MSRSPRGLPKILTGLFLAATTLLVSCGGKPLIPFSLETPPLILTPASMAGVQDFRGRFREIYCAIREDHGQQFPADRPCEEVLWQLSDEPEPTGQPVSLERPLTNLRILLVPGFFSDCGGEKFAAFSYALKHLQNLGCKTGSIRVNGRSSSAYNAVLIKEAILKIQPSQGEKLILVGYSKGAPDALETLVTYPSVVERIDAMVSVAGVIAGSPHADGLSQGLSNFIRDLNLEGCDSGDGRGLDELKRSTRLEWWSKNQLPSSIRYFSVAAFAPRENTSSILRSLYDDLAVIDPRNDSQVIFSDAVIPGSVLLGYAHADHWAIGSPISRNDQLLASTFVDHNGFPREVFLEAIVRSVEEVLSSH